MLELGAQFIPFEPDSLELTVSTKSKEPLLAVEWVANNQLLLVNNHSAELLFINEDKRSSKVMKTTNVNAAWAIYYAPCQLLLIANGQSCSNLQPIVVAHSQFTRMKNFEVDFGGSISKENFLEKDAAISMIYGKVYVMVFRYSNRSATMLDLYELPTDATTVPSFKHSLILGFNGGCGIHVIDNLVIVHHQSSQKSMLFDIRVSSPSKSHSPLVTTTIEPHPQHQPPPSVYTNFWFTFLPDVVIDSSSGVMYSLRLKNEKSQLEIPDKQTMLEYLARRKNEKKLFVATLLSCLRARALSLRQIRKVFAMLSGGDSASKKSENGAEPGSTTKAVLTCEKYASLVVTQQEMQSAVLIPLREDVSLPESYVANIMLQYLRSLFDAEIPPEAYLIEMVVETLAEAGEMSKLQQIVTYRVINDSKPLAFLLLSYEARCSTLFQSGVDILARNRASDEIVEVMLEKKQIVDAFRFIDVRNLNDALIPKVVEAANQNCSRQTRYAIKEHLTEKKAKASLYKSIGDDLYTDEEIQEASSELSNCTLFEL
uniref:Mic1 domain-containing protein n=1 Tax=Caenorhabditis tropicalis TaxID=1561998 RepID=A0A1I7T5H7_9PELO